jgi:hypothetical protein
MSELKELDFRKADGCQVTLLWEVDTNKVLIGLQDWNENVQEIFQVPSDCALDAFKHPHIYYGKVEHDGSS